MIKQIEINGYNVVEIKKRYESGDCLCDVQLVETIEEVETVKASDTDLIFTSEALGLTEEDKEVLNPKPTKQDLPDNAKR